MFGRPTTVPWIEVSREAAADDPAGGDPAAIASAAARAAAGGRIAGRLRDR
jgi:hypothetical protein